MSSNQTEQKKLSHEDISDSSIINKKIVEQNDKVNKLVNDKAEKSKIDEKDKILSQLKSEYKKLTGKNWSPQSTNQNEKPTINDNNSTVHTVDDKAISTKHNLDVDDKALSQKITEIGNNIRKLKAEKQSPEMIQAEVQELLKLKSQYKELTGKKWQGTVINQKSKTTPENKQNVNTTKQPNNDTPVKKQQEQTTDTTKHDTRLGMEASKENNFSEWYSQVITKGELIEYYDVSGCYILRPWSYFIWNTIKEYIDKEINKLGVQNCYFPMFVSKSALEKEEKHISNIAPEVAWVTKAGKTNLSEPIALRPTSETVMYPAFAKWLQSYRDLPIKLNQWSNVIRWEFKDPQPFTRTREFLWQEGHTAHAKQNEADDEVYTILDLYEKVYTELLAVPVIKGRKTEKEKFAGSDFTTTIEAFISTNGRGIQGATSHYLGQNFSKPFEIIYEDPETQKKEYVYQNSWGITTRTIGIMIMVHSDDKGLVLPPSVAVYQVVIVPCGMTKKLQKYSKDSVTIACEQAEKRLSKAGIRVYIDNRDNYSPGWKFHHWELKGVPVRLEIGPNDVANNCIILFRRDSGNKITIARNDVAYKVQSALQNIHRSLLLRAADDLRKHTIQTTDWYDFITNINKKCLLLSPFCGSISCEDKIRIKSTKQDSQNNEPDGPSMGAKGLCTPFKQPRPLKPEDKCIFPGCENKPSAFTLFGRSY